MFGLFKRDGKDEAHASERPPRHSRGWGNVLSHLKSSESQRVLDFGSTSPANINYLTSLGHSVYMANIVTEAARPEWHRSKVTDGKSTTEPEFDVDRFVASNLDFSGRDFDVILLWDTANYVPAALAVALFERLCEVQRANGLLLAFFHGTKDGPNTAFARYQLTDSEDLQVLGAGSFPVLQTYQTRQIEKFLDGYSSSRFFLGKDNMREVIATK